jgi:hypothetical protein
VTVADTASQWLAQAPTTWPDPPPMSVLHALILFVGSTALVIAVVTLLVMAPSLARGTRYRPGQQWDAQPEWFGVGAAPTPDQAAADRQLTAGSDSADSADSSDPDKGGASARW